MLVWNDLDAGRKDQGLRQGRRHQDGATGVYELLVSYRSGDMWAPQIEQMEALKVERQYLVDCMPERQEADSTTAWRV